tara:strand:+ start:454 stop:681 length:228 start_codon:yes stop_codon:yes gene_type:complete
MGGTIAIAKKIFKPATTQAAQKTSPTAPMVSQVTTKSMYDARKTKAKGRSSTISTSSKGVEDETVTLSRKSLLGK